MKTLHPSLWPYGLIIFGFKMQLILSQENEDSKKASCLGFCKTILRNYQYVFTPIFLSPRGGQAAKRKRGS